MIFEIGWSTLVVVTMKEELSEFAFLYVKSEWAKLSLANESVIVMKQIVHSWRD